MLDVLQTLFQGIAAAGALAAAFVAYKALVYFKAQADAATQTLAASRDQMSAEQKRWDDERRREIRRDHVAVRPEIWVGEGGGSQGPTEAWFTASFRGGKPMRAVRAAVTLQHREVAAECVPAGWPEIFVGTNHPFCVRASGVSTGDRGALTLTYVDELGSTVEWTQPLVADTTADILRLHRDPEQASFTADDLADDRER